MVIGAYIRVVPRDLFNEASLLKCYGRLWILLDNMRDHRAELSEGNGEPFCIIQDQDSGALEIANLPFSIGGVTYTLSRPLNARAPWPLWAVETFNPDAEEVAVFTDAGEFTPEFSALIRKEA
jgi:hypothetical protein